MRVLIVLLFFASQLNYSQQYPEWFIHQKKINCEGAVVGYAQRSYYGDTAAFQNAVLNAAENYIRFSKVQISGDQNFWLTALGNTWLGSRYSETFDTISALQIKNRLSIVDSFKSNNLLIVLFSSIKCDLKDKIKIKIKIETEHPPGWLNSIPNDNEYLYSVGSSEQYYYKENSWLNAERAARLNLARNFLIQIKSLQKTSTSESQVVTSEATSVKLRNIEVVSRWIDEQKKVYYVLIRTKIID